MIRSSVYSALVLRSRSSGEANRDIWLLTAEEGLLRATVFGGPKSKLRSHASPFHSGRAWIYRDPVKDSRKLTDLDVHSWRPGLRELYERAMSADAAAETVLASHGGGGNWNRALSLTESALDALAVADGETCGRILLCFLWQWIDFLGLRPDFDLCVSCGKPTLPDSRLRYVPAEGGMACSGGGCSDGNYPGSRLPTVFCEAGGGCRHWLQTVLSLSPLQLNRYTLDKKSYSEAKTLVMAILAETFGRKLASWEYV